MGLEKEHSNCSADRRQVATLRVGNPVDDSLSAKAPEIIGRLTMTVRPVEQTGDQAYCARQGRMGILELITSAFM
jgi:hypothetical protein